MLPNPHSHAPSILSVPPPAPEAAETLPAGGQAGTAARLETPYLPFEMAGLLPAGLGSILQDLAPGLSSLTTSGEAANTAARERLASRTKLQQGRRERQQGDLQAFSVPGTPATPGPSLSVIAQALEAREQLHALGILPKDPRAPSRAPLPRIEAPEMALVQILPPGPTTKAELSAVAATLRVDLAQLVSLAGKDLVRLDGDRIEPTELGLLAQRVAHYDDPDVLDAMDIRLSAFEAAVFGGSVEASAWTQALAEDLQRPAAEPRIAFHRAQVASMHAYDFLERAIHTLAEGGAADLPKHLDLVAKWYRMVLPEKVRSSSEIHVQRLEQASVLFGLLDRIQQAQSEGGLDAVQALITDPATYRDLLTRGPGLASGYVVAAKAAMTAYAALGEEATPADAANILQAVLQWDPDHGPLTPELLSMFKETPAIIQAALWTSEGQRMLGEAKPTTKELHHLLWSMIRPTLSWHQDDVQATVKDLATVAQMAGQGLDPKAAEALVEEVKRAKGFDAALCDLFLDATQEEASPKDRQRALSEVVGAITTQTLFDDNGTSWALTQEQAGALLWAVGRIVHSEGDLSVCVEAAQAAQAIALMPGASPREKAEMTQRATILSAILREVTGVHLHAKDAVALKEAYTVSALRRGDGTSGALEDLRGVVNTGKFPGQVKPRMSWPESAEEAALQAMIQRAHLAPLKAVITELALRDAGFRPKDSKDSEQAVGIPMNLATPEKGWSNRSLKDLVTGCFAEIGDVPAVAVFYDAHHTLMVPIRSHDAMRGVLAGSLPWGKAILIDLVPEEDMSNGGERENASLASQMAAALSHEGITTGFLHLPDYLERESARQFSRMND